MKSRLKKRCNRGSKPPGALCRALKGVWSERGPTPRGGRLGKGQREEGSHREADGHGEAHGAAPGALRQVRPGAQGGRGLRGRPGQSAASRRWLKHCTTCRRSGCPKGSCRLHRRLWRLRPRPDGIDVPEGTDIMQFCRDLAESGAEFAEQFDRSHPKFHNGNPTAPKEKLFLLVSL